MIKHQPRISFGLPDSIETLRPRLDLIVNAKDKDLVLERGGVEGVLVRADELDSLIDKLLEARKIFRGE